MNTVILFWNPAISSYTLERFQADLENFDDTYNWSVWEHEEAKYGDRFFLVRCGEGNTGICMSGRFSSNPYKGEDWSGRGREVYYMDMLPDYIINSEDNPILTTKELQKAIPDFNWTGGHSGRILSTEQAEVLEKLWKQFLDKHQDLFKLTSLCRMDNILEYTTMDADNKEGEEEDEEEQRYTTMVYFRKDGTIMICLEDEYTDEIVSVEEETLQRAKAAYMEALPDFMKSKDIKYTYWDFSGEEEIEKQYEKALDLCTIKHLNQKDKAGKPYLGHIARVASSFGGVSSIVALLHDIIEDTDVTADELLNLGFDQEIVDAVVVLTKQKNETYESFIERVGKNELARNVKIADLEDNMNIRRLPKINEKDMERLNDYLQAWRYLNSLRKDEDTEEDNE